MKQLRKNEAKQLFKQYKRDKEIVVILENIQYARNVASIFRTLDAAGIRKVYLTGISHTPPFGKDLRKASRSKERSVHWEFEKSTEKVIKKLKKEKFTIIAAEITDNAYPLEELAERTESKEKLCFIFGSEVYGVVKKTLPLCDEAVYVPMYGKGASLNVGTSLGIVLFSI